MTTDPTAPLTARTLSRPSPAAAGEGSTGTFLQIRGLRKSYGEVVAADIETLEVQRGQLLTLLGPSGCGKTTTLRCIAGLVHPELGSICIAGRDITGLPPHKRNLGMVFQNYAIFPHMSVFENVAYGLHRRGLDKATIAERVREALSLVELDGYEKRYRHQLSGGQQQRVALARAIVYQPDVLLLDEPFSNLDAKLRKTMRLEVRKLQRRLGLTTVFVTHDQQEALSVSDVLAVISGGRIEQVGTPAEVYEQPASEFVADFIGATNLLPGIVRACEGRQLAIEIEGGAKLEVSSDQPLQVGTNVKLLAKPEKLRLVSGKGSLKGEISGVAYLGAVTQYIVELPGSTVEILMPSGDGPAWGLGDTAGIEFQPDALRVIPEA